MAEKKTYCQLDKHPCMTNWSPLLGMVCIYEPRVKLEYDAETKQYLRRPDCPLEKQEEVKMQRAGVAVSGAGREGMKTIPPYFQHVLEAYDAHKSPF